MKLYIEASMTPELQKLLDYAVKLGYYTLTHYKTDREIAEDHGWLNRYSKETE